MSGGRSSRIPADELARRVEFWLERACWYEARGMLEQARRAEQVAMFWDEFTARDDINACGSPDS